MKWSSPKRRPRRAKAIGASVRSAAICASTTSARLSESRAHKSATRLDSRPAKCKSFAPAAHCERSCATVTTDSFA